MEKIRWGILSTGSIAHSFAKDLKLIPDAELIAVGSRSQSAADAFAQEYDIPNPHASYESLAQDPDVDVIYVATPHTLHAENSILCMRAGKAVLCEKAFAINAAEAEKMIRVAREEKVFLMEAMVTRHFPVIFQIQDWIKEGKIGEVRIVKATRCAKGSFDNFTRHLKPELGGGSLLDVGIYVISFASMIYGKPPKKSMGIGYIGSSGSDEQSAALLEYDAGAMAILTFALRTDAVNEAYIYGSEGYIKVDPTFAVAEKATLFQENEDPVSVEIPIEGNGLNYETREVMRCIRSGELESPRMPLNESLEIMKIMDEIRAPWPLKYPNDQ
jgi:predicted dehydrogenase